MSTMLLGTDLTDLLVTAAVHAGIVTADEAPALGTALVHENSEAYLWAYFDGPEAIEDWDDLDEDEQDDEELAEIVALRRGYTYRPAPDALAVDTAVIRQALATWCYQATAAPGHDQQPGWLTLQRLAAALDGSAACSGPGERTGR